MATATSVYFDPAPIRAGHRAVFYGIDWTTYEEIDAAADGRKVRMAYDRGVLEIMPTSMSHGQFNHVIARLVTTVAEELDLDFAGYDTFTLKREDLGRGVLPDQCFYFANAARVRGVRQVDLATDPPPDLVVEIDVASSSVDRLAIFEALGVPEVWRYDEADLLCYRRVDGDYAVAAVSGVVSGLRPRDLMPFVGRCSRESENAVVRDFRAWVRRQVAAGWPSPPA